MSDLLKKFKSIFVDDTGTTETGTATTSSTAPAAPTPTTQSTASNTTYRTESSSGRMNDKFTDILLTALEKNNQPGFDYFEFKESLKNLSKMPLDEKTRYQSAYAMAQTMGVTPATLIESAKYYQQVLATEEAKFSEAHLAQRNKLIGSREEEIKNLDSSIQHKAEQIKQLTQEIEEARNRSTSMRDEISQNTTKIEQTKADFEATFVAVMQQIQQDVGKIQEYLK
jgi:uncharacterized protein (DUF3084 family)